MLNAESIAFEELAATMSARDVRPLWEWARENVWLSAETGISRDHVGFYNPEVVPYAKGIQEAIFDPAVDWICVMKGVQLAITECSLNAIRRIVAEGMGDVIFAIDSADEVRKISEKRLKGTTFEDSPAIKKMLPADPDRMQLLTYYTRGSTVYLSGAGAAGKFANKPAPYVFLTELDKLPQALGDEAGVWELAEDRRTTFDYGIQFGESQPATEEGKTNQLFLLGTQEKYMVPCPECGMHQELEWERIKFDHCRDDGGDWDRVRMLEETYYQCANEDCKAEIKDEDKGWMLAHGEWVQTNMGALAGERSFHISGLYSPFPRMRWGRLAQKWIRAMGSEAGRKNFQNSVLGLPWKTTMSNVDLRVVRRHVGEHLRGTLPEDPAYLAMCVDVQGDSYVWIIMGMMIDGTIVIADYGKTLAQEELLVIFEEGVEILATGVHRRCQGGLIDSGFQAKIRKIYTFCVHSGGRFWPSKGRGGIQVRQTLAQSPIIHEGSQLLLYLYSDDAFKGELYKDRLERGDLGIVFPADSEDSFLEEFTHEQHVRKLKKWEWIQTGACDYADCVKLGQVLWSAIASLFGAGETALEEEGADEEDAESASGEESAIT